ncbi:MAG: LamG domain-containing protein [Armatimonadetes bacterium]|nr:LamG domain-containing protein [Armatimonadota bacterium]
MRFLILCLLALPLAAHAYPPAFQAPMDSSLVAKPGGEPVETTGQPVFVVGKFGQAVELRPGTVLFYGARGVLDKGQGTLSFWLRPNWAGDDGQDHGLVADQADYASKALNTFYLWKDRHGLLRFDLATPEGQALSADVRSWRAGEWHHLAVTWSQAGELALYVDGNCVSRRQTPYDPVSWPRLILGGDFTGAGSADAAFDEVRIYSRPLQQAHVMALGQNLPLEDAAVTRLTAPRAIRLGQPFDIRVQVTAAGPLTREYPLVLELAGIPFATLQVSLAGHDWGAGQPLDLAGFAVTVPEYLRLWSGTYPLTARLDGTVPPADTAPVVHQVEVTSRSQAVPGHTYSVTEDGVPMRDGRRFIPAGPDEGFLFQGRFYRDDAEGRSLACQLIASGEVQDAVRCRLVDAVEAAATDHEFVEWGQSVVQEVAPGKRVRLTGVPASATTAVRVGGEDRPVLPGFSYTLRTSPTVAPHVLVVEMAADSDRTLAIGVDAAPGSEPSPPLRDSGLGDTRLIPLLVTYADGETARGDSTLRQALLFYPKTGASLVTISSGGRDRQPDVATAAAVARLEVYELLDDGAALHNQIALPEKEPSRSVGLCLPDTTVMFAQFGFAGADALQRRASLGALGDYLGFMGVNRLEFSPLGYGMNARYFGGRLVNTEGYDLFDELLPVAERRGLELVPVLEPMSFYDRLPEFTDDSFQLDRDGRTYRQAYGRVPDPLRPEVQAQAMGFLSEFLERVRGRACVPFVAVRVDGVAGTCYSGDAPTRPPEEAGYSEWDLAAFMQATGVQVGGTPGDTPSRFAWLKANPEAWSRWITWRCEQTHAFWLKLRDLVVSRGDGRKLLIQTSLPSAEPGQYGYWRTNQTSPLDVLRHHGYDPRLHLSEQGLRISRCLNLGGDRYHGDSANSTYALQPELEPWYRTAEGGETELRLTTWDLPEHPLGHRAGPAGPAGRAFLGPLVHSLRVHDPYALTLTSWGLATAGHEAELRRFIRAYRALPAVPPTDFEGEVFPRREQVVVRRHGSSRLAVINDSEAPQRVRLTFRPPLPVGTRVVDLAAGVELSQTVGRAQTRVEVALDAWDLTALEIRTLPPSGDVKPRPGQP